MITCTTLLKYHRGNTREIILTAGPIESLFLIQHDFPNTTFLFGDDDKKTQSILYVFIHLLTFLLKIYFIRFTIQHRYGRIFLMLINAVKPCYRSILLDCFGEKRYDFRWHRKNYHIVERNR